MQTITVSLGIYVETATEAPRGSPTRADAPEPASPFWTTTAPCRPTAVIRAGCNYPTGHST